MRAGARPRFRRQDAHSSQSDRSLQRRLLARRRRAGASQEDHRGLRPAGEPGQGRGGARRPHGGAAARRYGAPHGGDRRGDRGAGRVTAERDWNHGGWSGASELPRPVEEREEIAALASNPGITEIEINFGPLESREKAAVGPSPGRRVNQKKPSWSTATG